MFYPQDIVDQVLESNNIVDVIGEYVNLTKRGNTYFGLCPFHNEKTASFSVTDNPGKHMFYCFGCHSGGSVLTFLMKYENCSYSDALKMLADKAGIKLPEPDCSKSVSEKYKKSQKILEINKDAAVYYYHLLASPRGEKAYAYLKERGLDDKTITSFGLGYSDKYRDDLYKYLKSKGYSDEELKESQLVTIKETGISDVFWNRVMFPIMDTSNRVIGFGGRVMGSGEPKYLNSRESICFEKNKTLYGLNVAKRHKDSGLILVEGYMDVISLHRAGFAQAVASLGTALTDNHAQIIKRYCKKVYISYDSDGPGQNATLRAIAKLKNAGLDVKIVSLNPYKDPDELIKSAGTDEYKKRLNEAEDSILFEASVLARSFDQNDPADKTRFGNELAARIGYISDELERDNYIKAFCQRYGFEYDILNSKVKGYVLSNEGFEAAPVREFNEKFDKKNKNDKGMAENEKMVLSILCSRPLSYKSIFDIISPDDFVTEPYKTMARLVFEQLKSGELNATNIINYFEDCEDQETVSKVIYEDLSDMSEDERKKALTDCTVKIRTEQLNRLINSESDINMIIRLKKEQEGLKDIKLN